MEHSRLKSFQRIRSDQSWLSSFCKCHEWMTVECISCGVTTAVRNLNKTKQTIENLPSQNQRKKREYVCFVCASFHESRFRGVNLLLAELSSTVWNVALPSLLSFVSLFYYSSRPYSIDPVPVLATLHVTVIARIISFSVMWGIVSSARHCSLHSHTLMIIQLHTYWVGLVRRQRNTL